MAKIIREWKEITLAVGDNPARGTLPTYTVKTGRSRIPLYEGADRSKAVHVFEEAVKAAPLPGRN
jgi:hypothetical protein